MCTEPFHTLSVVCWSIKEVGRHPENWFNSADTVEFEKKQEGDGDQDTADLPPAGDMAMHHSGPAGADCAQRCPAAVERDDGMTSAQSCYGFEGFFGPGEVGRQIFGVAFRKLLAQLAVRSESAPQHCIAIEDMDNL